MNTAQVKGNWQQLVGKAEEKWGRLTEDDWKIIEGKSASFEKRVGVTQNWPSPVH